MHDQQSVHTARFPWPVQAITAPRLTESETPQDKQGLVIHPVFKVQDHDSLQTPRGNLGLVEHPAFKVQLTEMRMRDQIVQTALCPHPVRAVTATRLKECETPQDEQGLAMLRLFKPLKLGEPLQCLKAGDYLFVPQEAVCRRHLRVSKSNEP